MLKINKIISGGQTGADRAALDFAIESNIPHGGWIPNGRKAEDGMIPDKYHLQEMKTADYPKRTEQNVIDSDGTLIVSHGKLTGGSLLTKKFAEKNNKPYLHIDMNVTQPVARLILSWIELYNIKILNVAGTRGSKDSAIYPAVMDVLKATFDESER